MDSGGRGAPDDDEEDRAFGAPHDPKELKTLLRKMLAYPPKEPPQPLPPRGSFPYAEPPRFETGIPEVDRGMALLQQRLGSAPPPCPR